MILLQYKSALGSATMNMHNNIIIVKQETLNASVTIYNTFTTSGFDDALSSATLDGFRLLVVDL